MCPGDNSAINSLKLSRLVLTCSESRGRDGNTAAWNSFDWLGLILGAGAAVHKRTNVLVRIHPTQPLPDLSNWLFVKKLDELPTTGNAVHGCLNGLLGYGYLRALQGALPFLWLSDQEPECWVKNVFAFLFQFWMHDGVSETALLGEQHLSDRYE